MKRFFFNPKNNIKANNDKKHFWALFIFSLFAFVYSCMMLGWWLRTGMLFFLPLSIGCAILSVFTGLDVFKHLFHLFRKKIKKN